MKHIPTTHRRFLGRIVALAAELSGYAPGELQPDTSFAELGFDSLSLTQLSPGSEEYVRVN